MEHPELEPLRQIKLTETDPKVRRAAARAYTLLSHQKYKTIPPEKLDARMSRIFNTDHVESEETKTKIDNVKTVVEGLL